MTGYLLDTNVISELMRKRPSAAVLERVSGVQEHELHTSSICIMELRFGAARNPRGRSLWERIEHEILPRLSILPVGDDEARTAGDVLARLEAAGTPIGVEDVLIGSTALVNGLIVATRNVKHLARVEGLAVENWWK